MRSFSARLDGPASRLNVRDDQEPRLLAQIERFWFTPADPTTLGLIRICAGLVVLYVHLIYVGSLQTYFGENAWFDRATANDFRTQFPVGAPRSVTQDDDPAAEVRS